MRIRVGAAALASALALSACGYGNAAVQSSWQTAPARSSAAAPSAGARAAEAVAKPAAPQLPPAPAAETRKPFVVIRFEGETPRYAEPLYEATERALKRDPSVSFDLVAVTNDTDAAARHLETVFRSMTEMGVPASRITLAAGPAADEVSDEVWIYVR